MDFSTVRHLLFDLGGVIIDIDLDRTFGAFARLTGQPLAATKRRFHEQQVFQRFEVGALSTPEFLDWLRDLTGHPHDDATLTAAWNALLLGIPPERVALLRSLRERYNLFLLSNTNAIHLPEVENILRHQTDAPSLDALFERTYYSYRLGLSKPGAAVFEHILGENGLRTADTLLIDDTPDNIAAAQRLGMQAVRCPAPTASEPSPVASLLADA